MRTVYSITCGLCKKRRDPRIEPNCNCSSVKKSSVFSAPYISTFTPHTTTQFDGNPVRVSGVREQNRLMEKHGCALEGDFSRDRCQERLDRGKTEQVAGVSNPEFKSLDEYKDELSQ